MATRLAKTPLAATLMLAALSGLLFTRLGAGVAEGSFLAEHAPLVASALLLLPTLTIAVAGYTVARSLGSVVRARWSAPVLGVIGVLSPFLVAHVVLDPGAATERTEAFAASYDMLPAAPLTAGRLVLERDGASIDTLTCDAACFALLRSGKATGFATLPTYRSGMIRDEMVTFFEYVDSPRCDMAHTPEEQESCLSTSEGPWWTADYRASERPVTEAVTAARLAGSLRQRDTVDGLTLSVARIKGEGVAATATPLARQTRFRINDYQSPVWQFGDMTGPEARRLRAEFARKIATITPAFDMQSGALGLFDAVVAAP
ncbi:MAG: hypothetical protein AAFR53_15080 [Pseudomonadota bacterium]